jgi:hypothetical protein
MSIYISNNPGNPRFHLGKKLSLLARWTKTVRVAQDIAVVYVYRWSWGSIVWGVPTDFVNSESCNVVTGYNHVAGR